MFRTGPCRFFYNPNVLICNVQQEIFLVSSPQPAYTGLSVVTKQQIHIPIYIGGSVSPGMYAETRPPVLWTGKPKCGRVFICLDSGRVNFFLNSYMYHGLQYVGLLRALYTSCYCHDKHVCISWASTVERNICRRRAYSQGFAKAVHMSDNRQNFDPA